MAAELVVPTCVKIDRVTKQCLFVQVMPPTGICPYGWCRGKDCEHTGKPTPDCRLPQGDWMECPEDLLTGPDADQCRNQARLILMDQPYDKDVTELDGKDLHSDIQKDKRLLDLHTKSPRSKRVRSRSPSPVY
jgi:hypothetical protein